MSKINTYKLRKDLEDYFGTAMFSGNPQAMMDLERVKRASDTELVSIAQKCGFNINNYTERDDMDYR